MKKIINLLIFIGLSVQTFFLNIIRYLLKILTAPLHFINSLIHAFKNHRHAFLRGLASFFLIGLGQARNKQWYKAIPLFGVLSAFLIFELLTSSYIYAIDELTRFPAEDGVLYFFRDYGGFLTSGLWGFFTLGRLVLGDTYRGERVVIFDRIFTWKSADNSQVLLGEGIIALVLATILIVTWILSIRDAYVSHKAFLKTGKIESVQTFIKRIWADYFAYIIIIPAVILIIMFTLIPFLFSFLVAFTNWTEGVSLGAALFRWTYFETFSSVFTNSGFLQFFFDVLSWTVIYAFMSSVTVYVLGLIQAIIIESRFVIFKKFWRAILILPWAIPGMISLMLFRNVFADNGGLINQVLVQYGLVDATKAFLTNLGLFGQSSTGDILWFSSPENGALAKVLVVIVNLWLGFPYFMMLITGVLGTIPKNLYEAADIDGANATQKFRFITLPMILRATAPVIVTTFTFNFNNFGAIYFLTGGGPGYPLDQIPENVRILGAQPGQTDILISWIYKLSFGSANDQYNLASVYSILIFVFIGLTTIYNLSKLKSFWEED
jgi:arabinogalactan oligomer/maltooligosaccharide transport system permease protein